jgi:hypothetical protein
MKKYSWLLIILFALTSPLLAKEKNCTYSYNPSLTKLEWTAYKFTEKTGVKGTFDTVTVLKDKKNADSILATMKSAHVKISTDTTNSGVPDRDVKIKTYFFGTKKKSTQLHASFQNIKGTTTGTADMNLQWNGVKKLIPIEYTIEGNVLKAKGGLDTLDFAMGEGINKLNEICLDLHIGKDGVSKLWSVVDFTIESTFTETCK